MIGGHPHRSASRSRGGRTLSLVLLAGAIAAVPACAKPKQNDAAVSTTSSSLPGGAVAGGSPVSVTTVAVTPSTTPRPPVCLASDTWGYAILKATDPGQRGELTPAQLTANLTTYADAIKALVPANGPDIDLRTLTAKKVLDGTALTDADKQAEKDAATRLDAWYKVTCPA